MNIRYLARSLIVLWLSFTAVPAVHVSALADEVLTSNPTLSRALAEAKQQDYERANQLTRLAELEGAAADEVASVRQAIASLKAAQLQALQDTLEGFLAEQSLSEARAVLIQWVALGADQQAIAGYRERISNIERYGAYTPGQIIRDTWAQGMGHGPDLVIIPEGQFMMGSTDNERGRKSPSQRGGRSGDIVAVNQRIPPAIV